jgi:hypothetical protein
MNSLRINPQPAAGLHPVNRPALPGSGRGAQLANAAGGAKQTHVHLNIARLSVAGMSHREQSRMSGALQQEFTRLVEASPEVDWQALSGLDRINTRPFPAGSTAEDIGRHVASEIFCGLRR